jgi:cAMP phosphodiesterase
LEINDKSNSDDALNHCVTCHIAGCVIVEQGTNTQNPLTFWAIEKWIDVCRQAYIKGCHSDSSIYSVP